MGAVTAFWHLNGIRNCFDVNGVLVNMCVLVGHTRRVIRDGHKAECDMSTWLLSSRTVLLSYRLVMRPEQKINPSGIVHYSMEDRL